MYTKGKWGVATIDVGASDDEIVTVINGCLISIASVFGECEFSEARPDGEDEPHYEVSAEEAAANARLIAAAPDLLYALNDMLKRFDYDKPEGPPDCIIAARAAIAKTEGR